MGHSKSGVSCVLESLQPERPAQAGTCPVVATSKVIRRAIVPVTVERHVPGEIAGDLKLVARIQIELDTARIIERQEKHCSEIQIGLVELE